MTNSLPEGMPEILWSRVKAAGQDMDAENTSAIAQELIAWASGRHPDDLESMLDALRELGVYAISLEVLEAAWNSDLEPSRMGRIAEDWVGTVLHGLGDTSGAREVAKHLASSADRLGVAFAADLGHLLLSWEMWDIAAPLIETGFASMPGDLTLRFNMGIIHKFRREWKQCATAFAGLVRHRPDDRASAWNLGIAATAQKDWATAREAWRIAGFQIPEGDDDFGQEDEATPVRLTIEGNEQVKAEVVWGRRICPARVAIRGIPRFSQTATFGDIVIIDGVPSGETSYQGQPSPIFDVLERLEASGNQTLRAEFTELGSNFLDLRQLTEKIESQGYPVADWSNMPGENGMVLGIILSAENDLAELKAELDSLLEDGQYTID